MSLAHFVFSVSQRLHYKALLARGGLRPDFSAAKRPLSVTTTMLAGILMPRCLELCTAKATTVTLRKDLQHFGDISLPGSEGMNSEA